MTQQTVSVCIPAYQAARHLEQTLRCALGQTRTDLEIVVLDNASTDGTARILADFSDPRLRVVRNDSLLPLAENWNHAVSLCRGELVKLLCADDLIRSDAVGRQAAVLERNPDVALVSSRRHLIADDGRIIARNRGLHGLTGRHTAADVSTRVVRSGGNPIGEPGSVMFRRADFEAVGGWDGALPFPMDLELWTRLLRHGDFIGMPEPLAAFRASVTSLSSRTTRAEYLQQRELTRRIAEDPYWDVDWLSRTQSHLGAWSSRARRGTLFAIARFQARHPAGAHALTPGLGAFAHPDHARIPSAPRRSSWVS